MDSNGKDYNSDQSVVNDNTLTDVDSKTSLLNGERKEEEETISLLPPQRGGLSRKSEKSQRKVKWNDNCGNKLAEVLEYQRSDISDSDDDESDSCICRVM